MCWPSPDPRPFAVARLDPATYRRHPVHGEDRAWPETNCYTDLAIEMAHALGFEPVAMLAFTLAIDFEGDQWTFFKPSACELYELYGFDIQELAISRPLVEHVAEQVEAGRAILVEVDSYHLPDTAGTAYRRFRTGGPMQKVYPSATAALDGLLRDGMLIAAGGFGLCGVPERLLELSHAGN